MAEFFDDVSGKKPALANFADIDGDDLHQGHTSEDDIIDFDQKHHEESFGLSEISAHEKHNQND